jgi:hypothetical protein
MEFKSSIKDENSLITPTSQNIPTPQIIPTSQNIQRTLFGNFYKLNINNEKLPDTFKLQNKQSVDFIFPEMYKKMCDLKSEIDEGNNYKLWDTAKRRVNPYELVNVLGTNILKSDIYKKYDNYIPLSRSFFKLTEMLLALPIIPESYKSKAGVIANIAEGPGGFIEASYKYRKSLGISDTHYGITLHSKNKNIPGWNQLLRRKSHFLNNKNIILKTGNLYNINTILAFSKLFKNKKAWLVTSDGGFDYSNDFNNQERNSRKIIYAEIITTLLIQENGGSMVCKMFDIFTYFSIQLIYLISLLYENIYIIKPVTSRPANSEKYIVACGFKGVSINFTNSMLNELLNWDNIKKEKWENTYLEKSMYFLLNFTENDNFTENGMIIENLNVPKEFIKELKIINLLFIKNQKDYIRKTLDYIKNYNENNNNYDKIKNKSYSNTWFIEHNIISKDNLYK